MLVIQVMFSQPHPLGLPFLLLAERTLKSSPFLMFFFQSLHEDFFFLSACVCTLMAVLTQDISCGSGSFISEGSLHNVVTTFSFHEKIA